MANALAGNRIMCITWIAPDEYAASKEGLDLAWVEAAEWFPTLAEMLEEFKIEMIIANQLSITHNLWD